MGSFLKRSPSSDKGCLSDIAPRPSAVAITGACICSASFTKASFAPEELTPPPTHIKGLLAADIIEAARFISSISGSDTPKLPGSPRSTSAISAKVSGGISISTGLGLPVFN